MPGPSKSPNVSGEAAQGESLAFEREVGALAAELAVLGARLLSVKSPRLSHPRVDLLLRFLRGEVVDAGERRAVVRHLLTGCPACVAITRPIWNLADEALQPLPRGN